jgi:hypothetical protein
MAFSFMINTNLLLQDSWLDLILHVSKDGFFHLDESGVTRNLHHNGVAKPAKKIQTYDSQQRQSNQDTPTSGTKY